MHKYSSRSLRDRANEAENLVSTYPLNIELPSLKSLFIEMYFGEQLLSTGTAILGAVDKNSRCALITNRHNVTGRHQETGECLSKTLGTPDSIVIYFHRSEPNVGEWLKIKLPLYRDDGTPYWIEHPKLGASVIPPKRAASKSRINTSPAFSAGRVSLLKPSYAFALE